MRHARARSVPRTCDGRGGVAARGRGEGDDATVTYYPVHSTYGGDLASLTRGPDGSMWFVDRHEGAQIATITPSGAISEVTIPFAFDPGDYNVGPDSLAFDGDGNLWFGYVFRQPDGESSWHYAWGIGKLTAAGVATPVVTWPRGEAFARYLTQGPDGNVWFTGPAPGRITPAGELTWFADVGSTTALAPGPDGNMWFARVTHDGVNWAIGRITPAGAITYVPFPAGYAKDVSGITAGPDGNVWFSEAAVAKVVKMSPDGTILAEYPLNVSQARAIKAGPDGRLYVAAYLSLEKGFGYVSVSTEGSVSYLTSDLPDLSPWVGQFVFGTDDALWFLYTYWPAIGRLDLHLDATPPVVTGVPDRAANAAGWYAGPVTIDWQAVDPEPSSGTPTDPPDTVAALEGMHTYTSEPSVDPAGNSARGTVTLSIDTVAPTVMYSGNVGSYTVDQTVSITCTASDAQSGVASSTCTDINGPAAGFGPGTRAYAATATDKAGNSGSGSTSFTVVVTAAGLDEVIAQMLPDQKVARSLVAAVDTVGRARNENARAGALTALDRLIDAQTGRALTAAQAELLKQLAAAL